MRLEVHQYITELAQLRHVHPYDWPSPTPGTYVRTVGRLELRITHTPINATWEVRHERAGVLTSGTADSPSSALTDVLNYAEHWVRTAMVGVLA